MTPKVGDRVSWFDIGPMRRYTGIVQRVTSATMLSVRVEGTPDLIVTVFVCDLDPAVGS